MSVQSRPRPWPFALALGCCAAAAVLASLPPAAHAADAMLRVAAVVARRASIGITQPASFTVSPEDVSRGWLEVDAPVQVLVRSNAPEGYALVFEQHADAMREVQVLGLGTPIVLAGGQAMAARPAPAKGFWTDRVTLRFRFALPASAKPGELPWPVQISLLPR